MEGEPEAQVNAFDVLIQIVKQMEKDVLSGQIIGGSLSHICGWTAESHQHRFAGRREGTVGTGAGFPLWGM